MKLKLADLLDIPRLQRALDSLYITSRIPSAIIDNDGIIHTGSGWQDLCTKFHRAHPEARQRCIESDLYITRHIHEADPSITYKCPHGLVDSATPIVIEGEHLGNVFTGQLFLEKPDLDTFRSQARAYGFDEGSYIEAVKKVPIISERALQENLAFIAHLTGMLAEMGLKRAKEKEAERRLIESKEKYRLVVENANDAIVIAQNGNIRFANSRFSEFIGNPKESVADFPFLGLIHPEDREWVSGYHAKRMRGEQAPTIYEFRLVNSEGETLWVENSVVLTTWEGRPATLSFLRDITQQKQLETQLVQSQKMEAVGRLAGGIAHDFNNLLTVITGYVDLILGRREKVDPLHKELVEIKHAADKAAALTRQLLAFSRKQLLQPKIVKLNEIVVSMGKILRRTIGEDIDLETVLDKDSTAVLVDPGQIEQVIINLAVNARDAMPDGGNLLIRTENVILDESFAREHPSVVPGPHVVLRVTDSGIGMSRKTMSKIFEPFFTTKEKGKGTGLGLSMTYGIVNQSKGHIAVESAPGSGTTFSIYLPKADGDGQRPGKTRTIGAVGGKETVLVVEDEPILREMFREILEGKGYSILLASSGEEAVLLADDFKDPIHLLVTDVVMPGMNGRELADRISAARQEIKVIFMSGYTDDAIIHHGVLGTGIEFLAKPFSPKILANKVREVLDAR